MEIINVGVAQRATFETLMNAYSSRSHTIFTISIVQTNKATEETITGMLNLVDLAGSERLKRSESEGQRFKEAVIINKSLSALGNVILGLDSNAGYIHYRDSKLTRILQDSLGGNSFTTLLATTYPTADNYEECIATLQFAKRCKNVQNYPRVNYVELSAAQQESRIRKLQEEIAKIREEKENEKDQFQRKLNELMSKLSMFGVQFDADGTLLGMRSARGGAGSSGPDGFGGSSSGVEEVHTARRRVEQAEKERESLNKKLEERKKLFSKVQEQARSDSERHAAEVSELRKKISDLEETISSLQQTSANELSNARRNLSDEVERIQADNDRVMAEQIRFLSSLPEALRHAMKSSLSPDALDRNAKGAISEEHYRKLLRVIDSANTQAFSQVRDMYQSFMEKAQDEIATIRSKAEANRLTAENKVLDISRQRDILYQMVLYLVAVAESGKTFPKHTGGTGIVLPEFNSLLQFDTSLLERMLKRCQVLLKEANDPLRPVVPRSHSRTTSFDPQFFADSSHSIPSSPRVSLLAATSSPSHASASLKRPASARVRPPLPYS